MAGDLDIHEAAFVLRPATEGRAADAFSRVEETEGRVLHRYGPRVMIGEVPAGRVLEETANLARLAADDLDAAGALGLAAFALRQSPEFAAAKANRPFDGADWDREGAEPPDLPPGMAHDLGADAAAGTVESAAAPAGPTSAQLVGSVAVGLVIVSGPTAALRFSAAEVTKIAAEVQNGLSWLGSRSTGGKVVFTYDIRQVSISTPPNPASPDLEGLWRNPAMAQLGFAANFTGVAAYVESLRTRFQTRWTFCAFFVKYPAIHYGYASIGGPRIVLQAPYDGWGPDNLDRVFAHETGHIFSAPDEYASTGCTCGGNWGVYGQPNGNCANCAPGGGAKCIMKSNDWAMCSYTPWHLGFFWPQGRLLAATAVSPQPPDSVVFGNRLFAFWKANDAANRIFFSASTNNSAWPAGKTINNVDATPLAPSAVVFAGKLHLFWKSNDASNRIFGSASADGAAWPNGKAINATDSTPQPLATAVFGNKLYLFWRAGDAAGRIFYSASADGVTWPKGKPINNVDATALAVSAVAFGNQLYLFWKTNAASNRIFFSASSDGVTWPNGKAINPTDSTPQPVASVVYKNSLYLFWKTNDASNRIYHSVSSSGTSWPTGTPVSSFDTTRWRFPPPFRSNGSTSSGRPTIRPTGSSTAP